MCQDIQIKILNFLKVNRAIKPKLRAINLASKSNANNKAVHHSGFTLIEVLVAVLIFGITALALSYTITGSLKVTSSNQEIVTANNYARQYLEDVGHVWQDNTSFTAGSTLPIPLNSEYNPDNKYTIVANNPATMATDTNGVAIVRRVTLTYKSATTNNTLVTMSMDYSKPDMSSSN